MEQVDWLWFRCIWFTGSLPHNSPVLLTPQVVFPLQGVLKVNLSSWKKKKSCSDTIWVSACLRTCRLNQTLESWSVWQAAWLCVCPREVCIRDWRETQPSVSVCLHETAEWGVTASLSLWKDRAKLIRVWIGLCALARAHLCVCTHCDFAIDPA